MQGQHSCECQLKPCSQNASLADKQMQVSSLRLCTSNLPVNYMLAAANRSVFSFPFLEMFGSKES